MRRPSFSLKNSKMNAKPQTPLSIQFFQFENPQSVATRRNRWESIRGELPRTHGPLPPSHRQFPRSYAGCHTLRAPCNLPTAACHETRATCHAPRSVATTSSLVGTMPRCFATKLFPFATRPRFVATCRNSRGNTHDRSPRQDRHLRAEFHSVRMCARLSPGDFGQ